MPKSISKKEAKELAQKAIEWITSPEGKESLKKGFEEAKKTSEKYEKACYIHPSDPRLSEPMTI